MISVCEICGSCWPGPCPSAPWFWSPDGSGACVVVGLPAPLVELPVVCGVHWGTPATPPIDPGSGNDSNSVPCSAPSIADFQMSEGRPEP